MTRILTFSNIPQITSNFAQANFPREPEEAAADELAPSIEAEGEAKVSAVGPPVK